MEKSEEYQIRLQTCEKCYEHENYDHHSEQEYRSAYQTIFQFASQMNIKIVKNVPPKYLQKIADTKNSSKRYMDTNTGKIIQYPTRGGFEVYYKNILLYSKLLVGTFPDISYLCLIIKQIHKLYQRNASILTSLQKFRDLQYQWKKNSSLTQSLYTFIKLNTCGNNSPQYLIDTLAKYIQNYTKIQNKKGKFSSIGHKGKVVHPYLLYDDREKMYKMETIYCPKTLSMEHLALTKRKLPTSKYLTSNFTKRRPQTGSNSNRYEIDINNIANGAGFITKNYGNTCQNAQSYRKNNQSYRQAGYIVKNYGTNHIFQLVLKQQHKQFDEQKLKKWRKQQKLCIKQQLQNLKAPKKSHWKSFSHQNIKRIKKISNNVRKEKQTKENEKKVKFNQNSKRKQDIKIDKTKRVYLAHLDKIKNKMEQKQKFKLNLNKKSSNTSEKLKSSSKTEQKISKINSKDNNNLSSSQFGSIKKNYADLESSRKLNKDEVQSIKSLNGQYNSKINNQRVGSCTSRNQKKNSKCLKQSRYSKIRRSLQPKNKQLSCQLSDRNKMNQIQNSSRVKYQDQGEQSLGSVQKANIEQKTVQKRISERKRSSNHERYPNNTLGLSRYNTLQRQIQFKNSFTHQDDFIESNVAGNNDDDSQNSLYQQWSSLKLSDRYTREPAMIVKKFSQQDRFIHQNSYNIRFQKIMEQPNCVEAQFLIKGEELLNKFVVKSIRQIYKPSQIRLFPQLFKQIQCQNTTIRLETPKHQQKEPQNSSQNHETLNIPSRFYQTKLIHLVNLMLRSNPMMISRIFEDKKFINPSGVYCIWLRNLMGKLQPIFINDQFALQQTGNLKVQGKKNLYKPIYSWLANQNSIWYMLLQKAVAKVLGGYHILNQVNLAQLMSIIMSSPTVDIGYLNPQKALKVFDQKIFYNKMACLYTMRQILSDGQAFKQMKQGKRIDRIIGFSSNKRDNKQSAISIKIQQSTLTFSLREFLLNYGEVAILFFNNNYFLNQTDLVLNTSQPAVLACKLESKNSKNNCYLMFSGFPEKCPTKVSLYKLLSDQQANIKEGMNPLAEQNKRYEYVGQISKTGNFFFEVLLNGGDYICLMENKYQSAPSMSLFSEYPVKFGQTSCNLTQNEQGYKQKMKKLKKQNKSRLNSRIIQQQQQNPTPKILIQHKIPITQFEDQKLSRIKKANKSIKNQTDMSSIKFNKKYAYEPDNIQSDKQNKSKVRQKQSKMGSQAAKNRSIHSNRLDIYSQNYSKFLQPQPQTKGTSSFLKQAVTQQNPSQYCNSNLRNRNINKIIDHYD